MDDVEKTVTKNLPNTNPGAETDILGGILTNVYIIAGVICVIVIITAGIYYAMSAGRSEHLTQAKRAIQYAVIGLVVVTSAFAITAFITGRL
ncbi:MAG: pilin [Candidatus Nomurabacteria bacterium]|jgi:hypothetical protein|nr:pilin [Candidatus Nomurabacteria bacterium]